jgi:hypothetical protein
MWVGWFEELAQGHMVKKQEAEPGSRVSGSLKRKGANETGSFPCLSYPRCQPPAQHLNVFRAHCPSQRGLERVKPDR